MKRIILTVLLSCLCLVAVKDFFLARKFELCFDAAVEKPSVFQIFCSIDEAGKFNERNSVKKRVIPQELEGGWQNISISLPFSKVTKIRVDIAENPGCVKIKNLRFNEGTTIPFDDFTQFKWSQIEDKQFQNNVLTLRSSQKDPFSHPLPSRHPPTIHSSTLDSKLGVFVVCSNMRFESMNRERN